MIKDYFLLNFDWSISFLFLFVIKAVTDLLSITVCLTRSNVFKLFSSKFLNLFSLICKLDIFLISFLNLLSINSSSVFYFIIEYFDFVGLLCYYLIHCYCILSYRPPTQKRLPWGSSGFTIFLLGDLDFEKREPISIEDLMRITDLLIVFCFYNLWFEPLLWLLFTSSLLFLDW